MNGGETHISYPVVAGSLLQWDVEQCESDDAGTDLDLEISSYFSPPIQKRLHSKQYCHTIHLRSQ